MEKARKAAQSSYLPIFAATNGVYVVLRLLFNTSDYTYWSYIGIGTLLLVNVFCYQGILDASETQHSNSSKMNQALAGGILWDFWGLTLVVQYGTALWSSNFYYLLCVMPPWGLYHLYQTFFAGGGDNSAANNNNNKNADNPAQVDEKTAAKRKKRAEKRRQKWS